MTNLEALEWRYATKKFDAEKIVPEEKVTILKKSFNLTPTSYGLQPAKLVVVKDQQTKEALYEHSAKQQQVLTASHILIFCIETEIDDFFIEENFKRIKEIRETPDDILAPFRDFLLKDFRKKSRLEKEDWATKQVYLAIGNMLTVCAAEKIDACPMEGFNTKKFDEVLQLKNKGLKSKLILPIGYRAEDDIFADFKKVRRPLDDVIVDFNN
ncbi:NAD(P)H-dependent oxidoreductase [Mesonia aquimarina]|uniref:NAD(P)H-dependent oxidoreductase n=1 Tax=Mesonia aquimarina TaxID=1504967 RepID=UPI000EF61E49|nr:NAD(P)H-dependent oxidoreductase [Mesonia aquimarina]